MKILLVCILAYLLGSFPFGLAIGKWLKGIDLQKLGSGNIGAANAFRNLGFFPGLLVMLGDMSKGIAALVVARALLPPDASVVNFISAGICAILGHVYSCFLKFKGGKGVATTAGVFFFISWKATLAAFSFWALVILLTRFASLASLTSSLALPIFMKLFGEEIPYVVFAASVFLFILFKHRSNVQRLLTGKENKLTFKSNG